MTNSRSESATMNKKRRVEHVNDAPGQATRNGASRTQQATNLAVDKSDPFKLVGSRLEPIHGILESQPPSLQTNIIRITKLMLEKLDRINPRISNFDRFTQPVRNPKTGKHSQRQRGSSHKVCTPILAGRGPNQGNQWVQGWTTYAKLAARSATRPRQMEAKNGGNRRKKLPNWKSPFEWESWRPSSMIMPCLW